MATRTSDPSSSSVDAAASPVLRTYLVLVCQLLLVLKVIQVFEIEGRRHLLPLMCLAAGGFLVHHGLPARYRPLFFLVLSLAGFVLVLGWLNTGLILLIGSALIGICHLPLSVLTRGILLGAAAGWLAYLRVRHPLPLWPLLGSIFMFRLAIYLREMQAVRGPVPLSLRLSYFFLLPNVCFPFFPLIDYQRFISTYRNQADVRIAQRGVNSIVRGIVQLVVYRLIKYQILPPPEDILNVADAALFLAANYGLYLYVSGTFHLIAGVMQLFGFNLPRTHDWFFFAHSFSDIWRRINIYWKDFLTQHIFFPSFFALRAFGNRLGIVAAVTIVFATTWLLHSYQAFWLLGDFPLRGLEAGLWIAAGLVVAVNALLDYHAARRVKSLTTRRPLLAAVRQSAQIMGVFTSVSIFWGAWTYPDMIPALAIAARSSSDFLSGWPRVLGAALILVAMLTAVQLIREYWRNRSWNSVRDLEQSPLPAISVACGLLILGNPTFQQRWHTDTARVLASLTVDYPTTLDLVRSVPGYYEQLAAANLQVDALFSTEKPRPRQGTLQFSDITRPRSDLLELELIPRWKGTLAGVPMSVNRWGMRDGPVSREKPENTTRIAVVGSSVVMGYGVRDEEVFTELLERQLNGVQRESVRPVEVLNFGVGRYYALHIAAALREKIYAFQPDALFYIAHQGELYGPLSHLAKYRFAGHSMPYPCLDDILRNASITDETPWGSMQGLLQPHAREITLCVYRGMVEDCRARGILAVWVYLPMPGIVEVSANTDEMLKLAQDAGFIVLDLSHWADGRRPEEVKFSATDHHANVLGHRTIAEQLFESLRRRPELLPSGYP